MKINKSELAEKHNLIKESIFQLKFFILTLR
jgi:hypothetical protein